MFNKKNLPLFRKKEGRGHSIKLGKNFVNKNSLTAVNYFFPL